MKAHNGNYGNELADQLAKEAASSNEVETAYNKIPKRAVVRELKEEGELSVAKWMGRLNQGRNNKTIFFSNYKRPNIQKFAFGYKPMNDNNRAWYTREHTVTNLGL